MNEFNLMIGRHIREQREKRGFTREELAELADMNDKYLYEVEVGRKKISLYKMSNLCNALDITIDCFIAVKPTQRYDEYEKIIKLLALFDKDELKKIENIIQNLYEIKKG